MSKLDSKTTILPVTDIIKQLDSFIAHNDVGTIFPENFFTSILHYMLKLGTVQDRAMHGDYSDYKRGDGPSGQITGFTITDGVGRIETNE